MDELLARAIKAYYVARRREGTIADQPNISNSGTETQRQALYRAPQQQGNSGGLPCSPRWGSEDTQAMAGDSDYLVTSRARASRQQFSGGRGRSANGSLVRDCPHRCGRETQGDTRCGRTTCGRRTDPGESRGLRSAPVPRGLARTIVVAVTHKDRTGILESRKSGWQILL